MSILNQSSLPTPPGPVAEENRLGACDHVIQQIFWRSRQYQTESLPIMQKQEAESQQPAGTDQLPIIAIRTSAVPRRISSSWVCLGNWLDHYLCINFFHSISTAKAYSDLMCLH